MAAHLHLAPALTETGVDVSVASPIRVVLADGHALMRHSLRLLLEGEDGMQVIAEAADLGSTLSHLDSQQPHVLVLDLRIPGGSSIETISKLRERAPHTQIVVLTMKDSPVFAQHALSSGALGFVLKELADCDLPQAVRAAARGHQYISARVAARLDAMRTSFSDRGRETLGRGLLGA
jgi:two-component system, NarL family, response regulator NreC